MLVISLERLVRRLHWLICVENKNGELGTPGHHWHHALVLTVYIVADFERLQWTHWDETFIAAWSSIVSDYYAKVREEKCMGGLSLCSRTQQLLFAWTLGSLPSLIVWKPFTEEVWVWRLGGRYMKPRHTRYGEMLLVFYECHYVPRSRRVPPSILTLCQLYTVRLTCLH